MANHLLQWVKGCQTWVKNKRIADSQITPELISIPKWILGPEAVMQKDLLPELPPSGVYENVITTNDVFPRYAFA